EDADINPLGDKVFRKVQAGTLRMASIGADPTKGHWGVEEAGEDPEVLYFDRQELLEFSIVPIGSNPEALKRNAEAITAIKSTSTRDINTEGVVPAVENNKLLSIREAQLIVNNH